MSLDFELFKTVLGFMSIVGGTISGVAALLVEYKDKNTGKVTKWGRYALIGVGVSFLIGASNLWLDYTQKKRESREAANKSREAAEQTLRIVNDISRTLNPLKEVRATFQATYPFDQPELAGYRRRLDEGVRKSISMMNGKDAKKTASWFDGFAGGPNAQMFSVPPASPLFPDPIKERFAHTVFSGTRLEIDFYKDPIDPARYDGMFPASPRSDLHMSFGSDGTHYSAVQYELETKKLQTAGFQFLTDPKYWDSSGKIVSVLDLAGTQMIVRVEQGGEINYAERDKQMKLDLDGLGLQVADRRSWSLRKDSLKLFKTADGSPFYVYIFPKTFDGLIQEIEEK
jgi:hypothetical protein